MASPNLLQDLSQQQQPDPLQQASDNVFQRPQPQPDQTLQSPPQPQQPPQGQPQPGQQPQQDPVQARMANLAQTIAQNSPQSADPTAVRGLLGNFFHQGMGALMNHVGIMTPEQKAQNATIELMRLKTGQAAIDLKDAQVSQAQQALDIQRQQMDTLPVTPELSAATGWPVGSRIPVKNLTSILTKTAPAQIGADSRENVANLNNATKQNIADQNNDTKTNIAGQNYLGKIQLAAQNEAFKRWKENMDVQTRLRTAQMTAGKAPAALMQTATFAGGALEQLNDARNAFEDLKRKGVLGSVPQDKIENWVFGHGLIDPSLPPDVRNEIGKMRAAMSYTSSGAMRAHTGRSSKEIYDDFKGTMGLGQGADALEGAMDQTQSMLQTYAQSASDAAISKMRTGGASAQPQQGGPSGRRVIDFTK